MKCKRIAYLVALASAELGSNAVFASGFQLLEQNASGLGNSYAGSAAVADDASTIFYNPAGMTQLRDHEVSLGGAVIKASYKFSNNGSSVAPASTGGNGGDAGTTAVLPNAYMSWGLNRNWYLGLGLGAPFGLKTEYDSDWVGRFQSIKFDIKTMNINPSVAWRIDDQVSVGFGLNWQRMEADYDRMAAVASPALPSGFWPVVQNTRLHLSVDNDAFGWNAGVLFKLGEATRAGLSYRSAIKHKLDGTLTSSNQAISPDVNAKVDITLPDTLILSAVHKLNPRWDLLADVSWTGWSKIDQVDIWRTSGAASGQTAPAQTLDARFRDTWRVSLGARQMLNEQWQMKYGVAYDQAPVRGADSRLVSLPDNDRIWLSVGTQYRFGAGSRVDLGLAYLIVRDTKVDNNQSAGGRGHIVGDYTGSVGVVGLQYSLAF